MVKSTLHLSVLLMGGLLCGGSARAEYMDWSYHWSIGPSTVVTSGTGSVTQTLYSFRATPGASRIPVAAVTTSSSAMARDPDIYNKNLSLTLHLTDLATHQSGNLTFAGSIRGILTYSSAHLYESFRTPIEHIALGKHMYWVRVPSYVRLMAPGSLVVPTYYASVVVENTSVPPPPSIHPSIRTSSITTASIEAGPKVSSTPEPSGLLLGSLGAVLLGWAVVWRIWG